MISSDHRSPKISSEMLTGQPERRFVLDFPTTFRTPYQCHLQNASRPIVKFSGACGKFVLLRKHNTDAARGTRLAVVSGNEGRCETKRSVDRSAANPCGDLHQRKPSADRVVRARDSDPQEPGLCHRATCATPQLDKAKYRYVGKAYSAVAAKFRLRSAIPFAHPGQQETATAHRFLSP